MNKLNKHDWIKVAQDTLPTWTVALFIILVMFVQNKPTTPTPEPTTERLLTGKTVRLEGWIQSIQYPYASVFLNAYYDSNILPPLTPVLAVTAVLQIEDPRGKILRAGDYAKLICLETEQETPEWLGKTQTTWTLMCWLDSPTASKFNPPSRPNLLPPAENIW
jgi:hypothetical protein